MSNSLRGAAPSLLLSSLSIALCTPITAQTLPDSPTRPLEPIVVTGNPFNVRTPGRPDSILSGDALADKLRATLGETLAQLPGVSSSYFGPTASRPIIRGLDGERIRILENGAASTDAASLSPDHAVPIDPIAVSKIEVLRGPAALLYGSNAAGGVVNALSDRIPRSAELGNAAMARAGIESVDRSRNFAARLDGLREGWALHLDGTHRESEDVRTPRFTLPNGEARERIENSTARTQSGALGLSRVWQGGFIGASVDGYRSRYGIVATDGVTIDMRREKVMIEGENTLTQSLFAQTKGHVAWTNYAHNELEADGEIGTRFSSRALQWRVDANTKKFGAWDGVVGISGERTQFTAIGDEAFVPPNTTQNTAIFGLARGQYGATELSAGARVERASVRSEAVRDEEGNLRFGDAQRKGLSLASVSASAAHTVANAWTLRGALATTERAPSFFERFANGVHVATSAVEVGDANLGKERAQHAEIGIAWKQAENRMQLNAYITRFRNFISLDATGETRAEGEDAPLPVYAFRAVPAQLVGAELDGNWRLIRSGVNVDVSGKWDIVRAKNRATNEPLARIAPMRATLGSVATWRDWRVQAEVVHAWAQTRVPEAERLAASNGPGATAAHTLVNASLSKGVAFAGHTGKITLRGTNLTNALAFNASSIQTIRERSPLPGRSVLLSIEMMF
jgi:iron complex outermembrane recepter protein